MSNKKKCENCGKVVEVLFGKFFKEDGSEYTEPGMQKLCETCAEELVDGKDWVYAQLAAWSLELDPWDIFFHSYFSEKDEAYS